MSDVANFSSTKDWPQKTDQETEMPIFDRRFDLRVRGRVIVELPCVEKFAPIHQAQLIFILKATDLCIGPAEQLQDPKSERRNPTHRSRNFFVSSVAFVVGKMQRKRLTACESTHVRSSMRPKTASALLLSCQ
jgi:hypothetical protein